MRGATVQTSSAYGTPLFQPAPPMRGATKSAFHKTNWRNVSTRAPHAGSDRFRPRARGREGCFNPRPPCGERQTLKFRGSRVFGFNPRPPCGERPWATRQSTPLRSFNPRPPCGERRRLRRVSARGPDVSTRAPHAGSDVVPAAEHHAVHVSTRAPHAGSDCGPDQQRVRDAVVSTRAPHAGSDQERVSQDELAQCFNPRPPCGERQIQAARPWP